MPDPYDQTPLLSLPYIQAGQAQKHVTHNEALERLDMLVQLTVEAIDATTPPASAGEGQAWIVGTGATGVWTSNTGDIAAWRGGGWLFVTPQIGWRVWDKTGGAVTVFDGTAWVAQGGTPDLDNLAGVGINAASDATNRLAVSSPATLLNHEGAGHQLKINKNTATDTASLLYQTDWSGRAEMGLAGNDDFSIKVSADGSTFTEALRVDAATGTVELPQTGTRQLLPFNYRFYLYADKRWVGLPSNPGSLLASTNLGTGNEPYVDWDAKSQYLPANSTINGFALAGNLTSTEVQALDLRFYFQHGPWNNTWDSYSSTSRALLHQADGSALIGNNGMCKADFPFSYVTPEAGYFLVTMRADVASTLTTTRYFYSASALDVTLPPS